MKVRPLHLLFIATLIAGLALVMQPVTPAHADDTITVTSNADGTIAALNGNDTCDLREAIQAANFNTTVNECVHNGTAGTDTINFAGNYTITLTGASGEDSNASGDLDIRGDLIINGTGAGLTVIQGGGIDRVFHVDPGDVGYTVVISDVTVRNGNPGAGSLGGGIYNRGTLTLNNSTVSGNTADLGGGIFNISSGTLTLTNSTVGPNNTAIAGGGIRNSGTLTLTNSTISGNTAPAESGGGISNNGTLTLNSSTISRNTATWGGGIFNTAAGTATLRNTIVAAQAGGTDCWTAGPPFTSNGYNLDSDGTCGLIQATDQPNTNPNLGPLADNGGPTRTHALLAGSPAIDTGDPACPATDQRGVSRPQDGDGDTVAACDTGAYEFRPQQQPPAPGGEDISEGTVGPGGLTLGDGCVKIIVEADAYPVGSIVAFDSNPSPDNSKVFGDFRLDDVLFFKVWVRGPDGAPMTEFSPPLLVCAQACRGGEGTTLFDWDEAARMWRAWPTFVQDGWHCTDWYGNLAPPPPGDQTTAGDGAAASGAQMTNSEAGTDTGAGTGVVEVPAAGPQVASAPSIGLPETGAPPGVSGLGRIALGVVIGLGMISGGVMLGRRAS
jgi:hypothetical protein